MAGITSWVNVLGVCWHNVDKMAVACHGMWAAPMFDGQKGGKAPSTKVLIVAGGWMNCGLGMVES